MRPGDSAEHVKRAFRERIKECHPDRSGNEEQARVLIEAYDALKSGVPIMETTPNGARIYRSPAHAGAAHRPNGHAPTAHTQSSSARAPSGKEYSAGYRAGQELFRSAMGGGPDSDTLHQRLRRQRAAASMDVPGIEFFKRAEDELERTIRRFEGQKNRSKRYWAREYITGIVRVQILYRDVISRYPMLAPRARDRMHSLEKLLLELRTLAR